MCVCVCVCVCGANGHPDCRLNSRNACGKIWGEELKELVEDRGKWGNHIIDISMCTTTCSCYMHIHMYHCHKTHPWPQVRVHWLWDLIQVTHPLLLSSGVLFLPPPTHTHTHTHMHTHTHTHTHITPHVTCTLSYIGIVPPNAVNFKT